MALPTNSFRTNRYFRSKFNEGKYLLAAEATDLQLETQDYIKEFLKNSYGNIAVGNGWKVDSISSTQLRIRPGIAFDSGIPYVLKSGSDGVVVAGISPVSGYALADQSATTSDAGGKKITTSGTLANGNYTIVIEAREELVKPSGSGAVDAFLQGVNVNEETGNKLRLIYKIHTILSSDLTETPTFPQSGSVHNFSNRIVVTPQTGVANFVISSIPITQDVNGADLRLTLDNANSNLPYSTDAQEYVNGLFIDSDGNEMTITSITTEDGGATVKLLLDRQVEYNSSTPKSGTPVITNLVSYQLIKRDYYVSSNGGVPLGQHYMKIASFTATGGSISALTDLRTVSDINTFGVDSNARLTGGGTISFDDSTDTVTFGTAFKITFPSSAAVVTIASGTAVLPSDASVAYFDIDRNVTTAYTRTLTIASKATLSKSVNHYIVMERRDNRIFFPHNGSVGDGESGLLGAFSSTLAAALVPIGSMIPHYDFNGALVPNSTIWKYCDGSTHTVTGVGSVALPDMSNRYVVGFGTEAGGDNDSAAWATTPVGNASHQVDVSHSHTVNSHTHSLSAHTHTEGTYKALIGAETGATGRITLTRNATTFTGTDRWATGGIGMDASNTASDYSVAIDGVSAGPSTANTSAASPGTDTQLSATQSIQPRSIRVRWIMRVS